MIQPKARICIVNYKTPELIRVCLRAIRKFTDYPIEVVVVDNDSKDESVEYLRSLDWIRLIERKYTPGDPRGSFDEGAAYDLGLADCQTEFFVVMHSDTIALRPGWLTELIGHFNNDARTACVGSDKIEIEPAWRAILKKATDFKKLKRKLLPKPDPLGRRRYHNRTICCLYRTDVLKKEKLSFLMDHDKGFTTGKRLYLELVDRGYKTVELPIAKMKSNVLHLTHATQITNPKEFPLGKRTFKKWSRIIKKRMAAEPIRSLLADDSLDK
ncbi:MAG: hypothetical protein B6I25_07640 [Planctomycetales bacterium 4572_13]|nr:MAG: hypothetical protein B6I25_07640 [Planctomycetales bacterium 4572_13]